MRVDVRKAQRELNALKSRIKRSIPKALNKSGEKTVQTIVERTQRGIGLKGAFKRYSPEYADYRSKMGRGGKPDLNFSGRMLSNLGVERVNSNKVKVAFGRKEEETKARINQKTRPFVGVRPQEVKFIADAFKRQFMRDIK
jgi:phage gpG-like protein